jgi:RNA polymerase sigma-70 factor (ECF subfamily)
MDSHRLLADKAFIEGVRRFVSARVPAADVDDVAQNVFVRAHEGVARLHDEVRTEAWILAIARKAIADYYRKRSRQLPSLPDDQTSGLHDATVPSENLSSYAGEHDVHEEVMSWLRPTADELPEPYRTALIKADFEGVPQRELARALGLSESGLKSRVQRARVMLADAIRQCCEVEFGSEGRAVAFHRLRRSRRGL